jgi:hypothetical protein
MVKKLVSSFLGAKTDLWEAEEPLHSSDSNWGVI